LTAEKKEHDGKPISFVKLEGDDEKAYWDKIFAEMAKKSSGGKRPARKFRR